MPVTVAEIVELPIMALAGARVVAGHRGLRNAVRWVHVADVRDIARLLQGGELVLSTGLPLARPAAEQRSFIRELSEVGAAGLVLELVRRFRGVPAAMIAAADEIGLPVVALAREVPFVKVTEAAHTLIVNRQYAQIREAEAVATALNGVALRQEGILAILRALSRALGNPVLYLPIDRDEPAVMHPPDLIRRHQLDGLGPAMNEEVHEFTWNLGDRSVQTVTAPVLLGQERSGSLFVPQLQRQVSELDLLVLRRAATTIAFEILRQKSMRQQWQMSTGQLLEDILVGGFRDHRELRFRAQELGLQLDGDWFAVVTVQVGDPAERARIEQKARAVAAQLGYSCIQAARGDRLRLLMAATDVQALPGRVSRLASALERPAGASRPFRNLTEAPAALEQAEYTLSLCLRYPASGFGPLFDSTGTYRLLLVGARTDELTRFVEDELGPLLRSGRPDNPELLRTLRLLLDTGLNFAEAARRLHLTRQALYYRKERIESALACSLDEPEKRISLGLALRALELLQLKAGAR